ncbi:hypothetical protein EZ428_23860 [Pedobacter frigiditerrae]|uniref:Aspartyl protease family protein n=1 Tax=Pedobacter frigiditerrae TaxID=2530452 RepID=A0A4R0MJY7_9SPHI|nr:retropepsin-like aspartic protease [Pedobacter frigiditerrae]TCC86502.1 hypothetical protein EZ428_23860 [Pedobacter frigiditerrae]
MKLLSVIFLLLLVIGCSHPEDKDFERNKGVKSNADVISSNEILQDDEKIRTESPKIDLNDFSILKMESENGVKYVWIEINGIRLRFIFDTGASSICISPAEASVLYRQGTLRKEDILDMEYFQDATGKISEGTSVNLRIVKVGNKILENVKATVVDNINSPLLLGQSVLENFGHIEIDNENNQIILR